MIRLLVLFMMLSQAAYALDTDRLPNPAQEVQARALMQELRCLVCQNESIADSNADLAVDLRTLVRQRISMGETNAQVKQFLVARYGDWVLLNPPLKPATWLLWAGPLLVIVAGAALLLKRRHITPADLTDEERAAFDKLGHG